MKKILSFLVCISIVMSLITVSAEANNSSDILSDKKEGVISFLGLRDADIPLDAEIKREELAKLFAKAAVDSNYVFKAGVKCFSDVEATDSYAPYINFLFDTGIVKGNSNSYFEPDVKATTYQAIVMAVRMLGYENVALKTSYLSAAASKNLYDGVLRGNEENITYGDALNIVFNALTADISDAQVYDYNPNANITYLGKKHSVFKIKGEVTDNGINSVYGESLLPYGKIKVGDSVFYDNANASESFGTEIEGYYKYDIIENTYTLISAYSERKTDVLKILSENIEKFENFTYTYLENADDEKSNTVTFKKDITIIYNGKTLKIGDKITKDMFVPKNGEIILFDADGDNDYDILYINNYETAAVNLAEVNNKRILLKDSSEYIDLGGKDYTIFDSDANEYTLSDLKEYDILSVRWSIDRKNAFITLTRKNERETILGVDRQEDEVYTVSDKKFKMSEFFKTSGKELKISETYTFYFDMFDKIAYAVLASSDNSFSVGYMIKTGEKSVGALDKMYCIKILDEDSTVKTVNFAERVKMYYSDDTYELVKDEDVLRKINGYTGIFRYVTDKEGNVSTIEFPLYKANEKIENRLTLIYETSNNAADSNYYGNCLYRDTYKTFAGEVFVDNDTDLYIIPDSETDTDKYRIADCSVLDDVNYKIKAYAVQGGTRLAKYAEIMNLDEDNNISEYPIVITNLVRFYDHDNQEEVTKITALQKAVEKEFYIKNDTVVYDVMHTSGKQYKLGAGDIVKISSRGKYITSAEIIFDADMDYFGHRGGLAGVEISYYSSDKLNGNPYVTDASGMLQPNAYLFNKSKTRVVLGYVYSYKDGIVNVTTQDVVKNGYDKSLDIKDGYLQFGTKILNESMGVTYTSKKNITAGKASVLDVKAYEQYGSDCTRCLLITNGGYTRGLFLLNGEL